MSTETLQATPPGRKRRPSLFKILLIVVAVANVTSVTTVWLTTIYLFPKEFKPVKLNDREESALNAKLAHLDPTKGGAKRAPGKYVDNSKVASGKQSSTLKPERYSETGASRQISFSERELNAMLAHNTDLAHKLAIDLSEDQVSAKLLIPLDPDFPFLGGKTLRASAGLELRYNVGKPVVMFKGVSLWGVPIPNAWLGGIKNIDLIKEFGPRQGFWQTFSAGVENIRVEEGNLSITLSE